MGTWPSGQTYAKRLCLEDPVENDHPKPVESTHGRGWPDEWPVVAAVMMATLLGAALAFHRLDGQSLWGDEITMAQLALRSLRDILTEIVEVGRNPSWYWFLIHLFAEPAGTFLPRVPAALFAAVNIPLAFKVGSTLFSRREGLVAAFLLAVSPLHVRYAQEVRQYTALITFSLLSLYFLWLALRSDRPRDWVAFAGSTVVCVTAHAYGALPILAAGIFAVVYLATRYVAAPTSSQRRCVLGRARHFLLAGAAIAVAWGPAVLYFIRLTQRLGVLPGGEYVRPEMLDRVFSGIELSWTFIENELGRLGAGDGAALVPYVALFLIGLVSCLPRAALKVVLVVLWLAVPYAAFAIAGVQFITKYVIYVLPLYLIFVSRGLVTVVGLTGRLVRRLVGGRVVSIAWSAVLAMTVAWLGWLSRPGILACYGEPGHDWRGAAEYLLSEVGETDVVIVMYDTHRDFVTYYADTGAQPDSLSIVLAPDLGTRATIPDTGCAWWVLFRPGRPVGLDRLLDGSVAVRRFSTVAVLSTTGGCGREQTLNTTILVLEAAAELNVLSRTYSYSIAADLYALQGQQGEAISVYAEVLEEEPGNLPALLGLAAEYERQAMYEEALSNYLRAVELYPGNAYVRQRLSQTYARMGAMTEAIAEAEVAVQLEGTSASLHAWLGSLYSRIGDWDRAVDEYVQAIGLDPGATVAYAGLGDVYRRQGSPAQAIEEYQRALHSDPTYAPALVGLGTAYEELGELELALETYRRALEEDPALVDAYLGIAGLYEAEGDLASAVSQLESAAAWAAGNAQFYIDLGRLYLEQGRPEDAFEQYREAIRLRPLSAVPYFLLGNALRQEGRLDEALEEYAQAVEADPLSEEAWMGLALTHRAQGDLDAVVDVCRDGLETLPESADLRVTLGDAYVVRARQEYPAHRVMLELAEMEYGRAIAVEPTHAAAHMGLGEVYQELERWEAAIDEYQAVLVLEPGNGRAYLRLGQAYEALADYDAAVFHYREATRLEPEEGWYHRLLGHALASQGLLEEAIAELLEAAQLRPDYLDDPWFHKALGSWYRESGRPEEAVRELEEAMDLMPGAAGIRYELALSYQEVGRVEDALAQFEQAALLAPDSDLGRESAELAQALREAIADDGD